MPYSNKDKFPKMKSDKYEQIYLYLSRTEKKLAEATEDMDNKEVQTYLGEEAFSKLKHEITTTRNKLRVSISILESQIKQTQQPKNPRSFDVFRFPPAI